MNKNVNLIAFCLTVLVMVAGFGSGYGVLAYRVSQQEGINAQLWKKIDDSNTAISTMQVTLARIEQREIDIQTMIEERNATSQLTSHH